MPNTKQTFPAPQRGREQAKPIAISLFSGAGGLDLGFLYAGFEIPIAVEINKQAAYTYAQNLGAKIIKADTPLEEVNFGETVVVWDDIKKVKGQWLLALYTKITGAPQVAALLGGPPCQSWSFGGNREGKADVRGQLIYEYLRLLCEVAPQTFLFENVKGIISKRFLPVFLDLCEEFSRLGYDVQYELLNSYNYGVAQTRERVFIVGQKTNAKKFSFPPQVSYKLVLKDIIGDLPQPQPYQKEAGQIYAVPKEITAVKSRRSCFIPNPTPMSPDDNPKDGRVLIRQGMIIPVEGLKQDVVANHEEMEFGFSSRYLSRNRQRQWHQPGFTIVCSGKQQALYPDPVFDVRTLARLEKYPPKGTIPRRLTVRECMRIQSFPDWFILYGTLQAQYQQVGNAVPVVLGYCLGQQLKACLALA